MKYCPLFHTAKFAFLNSVRALPSSQPGLRHTIQAIFQPRRAERDIFIKSMISRYEFADCTFSAEFLLVGGDESYAVLNWDARVLEAMVDEEVWHLRAIAILVDGDCGTGGCSEEWEGSEDVERIQ